ncbi:hypothetical protein QFC22_006733 [Naganishia vaughanmartiniae]|uniref:Uncharacterized protein n=1 Tax=Naganishia vaughanmartiniae TaxID=1424756 RepID=A0ACC2WHV8_9TREE|nr:hypothetical protein QFC22_006733 [Naganishia vaughanmartiniae]
MNQSPKPSHADPDADRMYGCQNQYPSWTPPRNYGEPLTDDDVNQLYPDDFFGPHDTYQPPNIVQIQPLQKMVHRGCQTDQLEGPAEPEDYHANVAIANTCSDRPSTTRQSLTVTRRFVLPSPISNSYAPVPLTQTEGEELVVLRDVNEDQRPMFANYQGVDSPGGPRDDYFEEGQEDLTEQVSVGGRAQSAENPDGETQTNVEDSDDEEEAEWVGSGSV